MGIPRRVILIIARYESVDGDEFDLVSAYMAAAWNDDLMVKITGFMDGARTGEQTVTLDQSGPTLVQFDNAVFDSVDKVTFHSSGGTDANPADGGAGTHFVVDDMTIVI